MRLAILRLLVRRVNHSTMLPLVRSIWYIYVIYSRYKLHLFMEGQLQQLTEIKYKMYGYKFLSLLTIVPYLQELQNN